MDGDDGMNIGLGDGSECAVARRRWRTNKPANFSAYSSAGTHEGAGGLWPFPGPHVAQCENCVVE